MGRFYTLDKEIIVDTSKLELLHNGKCLIKGNQIIVKQVETIVPQQTIPYMTSLPQDLKKYLEDNMTNGIHYVNQYLIITLSKNVIDPCIATYIDIEKINLDDWNVL